MANIFPIQNFLSLSASMKIAFCHFDQREKSLFPPFKKGETEGFYTADQIPPTLFVKGGEIYGLPHVLFEEGVHEFRALEAFQVIESLSDTDIPDGNVKLTGNPYNHAALRRSVQFG